MDCESKCQLISFSKRRNNLIKKLHEISIYCDVDVAFVAFSPSGQLSKFCNRKRIGEVIERYINLPADKKYNDLKNVKEKHERVMQLGRIGDYESKLHYLNTQIKHFELQIKKSEIELEIQETILREYEPDQEDPTLAHLIWCEKNLRASFQHFMDNKRSLLLGTSQSSYMHDQKYLEKQRFSLPLSLSFNNELHNQLNLKHPTNNISPNYRSCLLEENQPGNSVEGFNYANKQPNTNIGFSYHDYDQQQQYQYSGHSSLIPIPAPNANSTDYAYAPVQQENVIGFCDVQDGPPHQQPQTLSCSEMGMVEHDAAFGDQQYTMKTLGHGDYHNLNGYVIPDSDWTLSSQGYDQSINNTVIRNNVNNYSISQPNNTDGSDQFNPLMMQPQNFTNNYISNEPLMENNQDWSAARNPNESRPLEDGFVSEENLVLDDLDFLV